MGRDGNRLVLLVALNSQVSVYDATYGTPLGSFSIPAGFNSPGSTDTLTVIGNVQTNQLQMIDVGRQPGRGLGDTAGRQSRAVHAAGRLQPGGRPDGNARLEPVYSTIAATFNSFQPNVTELGLLDDLHRDRRANRDRGAQSGQPVQHRLGTGDQGRQADTSRSPRPTTPT